MAKVQGDDRDIIGNPVPLWIVGMTNSFTYKNFDLSIVVSGGFGFELANMVDQFAGNLDGVFNVYKAVDNRWKSPRKIRVTAVMERPRWVPRLLVGVTGSVPVSFITETT